MTRNSFALALLGASAFMAIGTAQAQEPASADAPAVVSDEPALDEGAANNEFLQAQVESLQAQIDGLKKQMTAAQPTWKGAPQWTDADSGWTFKPKGVIQFDAGYVSLPGTSDKVGGTIGGVNTNNLGWNMRARRLIFGAEGAMPGGFGYKLEFELSQGSVNYEDLILNWQKPGSPVLLTVGYHYPLSSLELLTSNRFTSFMERAGMNDAFGYGRRVGVSAAYLDPAGQYTLTAGAWGADINDNTNFNRNNWQASVRGTYSPMLGSIQGHLGFQFQHRSSATDARNVRYRERPFTQTTDQRFIDTKAIAAKGDDILGGELAAIYKSLHFASEFQYVWVRGIKVNAFGPNNGAGGATIFPAEDPQFFSGYAEVGYFLTGETRGYKGGKWDRTKVLHPVDKGGMGAVQINVRFDYTDLGDRIAPGALASGTTYVNGGKMAGYQASLIWLPTDYVKFLLQYTRAHVEGGAAAVSPFTTSADPFFERPYNVDQFGLRAQLDF